MLFVFLCLPSVLSAYCCAPGPRDAVGWWGTFDYLFLWRKARFYPPLASTGTLGEGGEVLFGDGPENGCCKSGFRGDFGIWIPNCFCKGDLGIGTSVIVSMHDTIKAHPQGSPLARPYLDVTTGLQNSLALTNGDIAIRATNQFWTWDGYLRFPYAETDYWGFDLLLGVGFIQLQDNLKVTDHRTVNGIFSSRRDHFTTDNNFYSGMIGFIGEFEIRCVTVNFWGKLLFGDMVESVEISGTTESTIVATGATTVTNGGFLALPTNLGDHSRHHCSVMPVLGANLNINVCGSIYFSLGYLWLYFPHVALAGEQIDLTINNTQFNGGTLTGTAAPLFDFHNTSFWVQGVSIGIGIYY